MNDADDATRNANARPAAPAEPAYDLAADRERRARVAKEELGPKTITTVVSDIFVVIGPPGWQGGAFEQSVSLMRNSMAGYLNNRFGKKPSQAISVYLFPEGQTYETFCKKKYAAPCIAHYGFYQPGDRYMVMNIGLGLGTLTHEIVHPLVESDFPEAPTWLNEGIASVFEAPVITKPGEIHGVKNWRHPRLKKALTSAEREHARLDVMFAHARRRLPRRRRGPPLRDGSLRVPVARRARQAVGVLPALARYGRDRPERREGVQGSGGNDAGGGEPRLDEVDARALSDARGW